MSRCGPGRTSRRIQSFAEDSQRIQALPAEALRLLDEFLVRRDAGETGADRPASGSIPESRGCRFYEWRPSTCRVFELNSMGCRIYRHRNGLGRPGNCRKDVAAAGHLVRGPSGLRAIEFRGRYGRNVGFAPPGGLSLRSAGGTGGRISVAIGSEARRRIGL